MRRAAIIFASGILALTVTAAGFYVTAWILNTSITFFPHTYHITWIK